MSTKPEVSVLMPAYNADKYIADSINSILNQTFKNFELIIIDDGSQDKTWDIIQAFVAKDSRITAFKNSKNSGISFTRNELIRRSSGEFLAWQDADDVSIESRLELQYAFMKANEDVGICGGFLEFFNSTGVISIRKYSANDNELRNSIFRYSPVSQPVAMLRKSIVLQTNGFDEGLVQAEDLDLSFRIGRISKFANVQSVLLRYRQSSGSISSSKLKQNIRQTLFVRRRAQKLYGYKMKFGDVITFFITYIFQFLPNRVTIFVFNILRNS